MVPGDAWAVATGHIARRLDRYRLPGPRHQQEVVRISLHGYGLHGYGLHGYGLHGYGLRSYDPHSYGLCSCGLSSYDPYI